MIKPMLAVAVSFALSAATVLAAEEHQHGQEGAPAEDTGGQMRMMQENMNKMHEQMHKIMEAKDPKERERLMEEQRKTMQEHMKQMRAGMGGMMNPGKMDGAGKAGAMEKPADK